MGERDTLDFNELERRGGEWEIGDFRLASRYIAPVAFQPIDKCLICPPREVAEKILLASGTQFLITSPPSALIKEDLEIITDQQIATLDRLEHLFKTAGKKYIKVINTARSTTAQEAIERALEGARVFRTKVVKLEIFQRTLVDGQETLIPIDSEVLEAAKALIRKNLLVTPYINCNPELAQELIHLGASGIRVYTGYIGLKQGFINPDKTRNFIEIIGDRVPVIGEGGMTPESAKLFMEMGGTAVLANRSVLSAEEPVKMAQKFRENIVLGRLNHLRLKNSIR